MKTSRFGWLLSAAFLLATLLPWTAGATRMVVFEIKDPAGTVADRTLKGVSLSLEDQIRRKGYEVPDADELAAALPEGEGEGLLSKSKAIEVGKQLDAEYALISRLIRLGTNFEFGVRLINVAESTDVSYAKSMDVPVGDLTKKLLPAVLEQIPSATPAGPESAAPPPDTTAAPEIVEVKEEPTPRRRRQPPPPPPEVSEPETEQAAEDTLPNANVWIGAQGGVNTSMMSTPCWTEFGNPSDPDPYPAFFDRSWLGFHGGGRITIEASPFIAIVGSFNYASYETVEELFVTGEGQERMEYASRSSQQFYLIDVGLHLLPFGSVENLGGFYFGRVYAGASAGVASLRFTNDIEVTAYLPGASLPPFFPYDDALDVPVHYSREDWRPVATGCFGILLRNRIGVEAKYVRFLGQVPENAVDPELIWRESPKELVLVTAYLNFIGP